MLRRFVLPAPGKGSKARERETNPLRGAVPRRDRAGAGASRVGPRRPDRARSTKMVAEARFLPRARRRRAMTPGGVWTAGAAMGMASCGGCRRGSWAHVLDPGRRLAQPAARYSTATGTAASVDGPGHPQWAGSSRRAPPPVWASRPLTLVDRARHHGVTRSAQAGSTASPRRGITSRALSPCPATAASRPGSSQACSARAEGAPVHRQERAAAEQVEGLRRIRRAEVDVAPGRMERADLKSITRSNGLRRSRIVAYSLVSPVSPLKNTSGACHRGPATTTASRCGLQPAPGKSAATALR